MTADFGEAAVLWRAEACRLIKDRENAVYEIRLSDGSRAALRLHRPGYQTHRSIRSELELADYLGGQSLPVPRPIPSARGALVEPFGDRLATVVTWIDGRQIGDADTPLGPDPADLSSLFRELGGLIARLHNALDRMAPSAGFERQRWDAEGFLGRAPLWGRFWENPSLSPREREELVAARDRALERFAQLEAEGADFGLIHADLLRENVLAQGKRLSIIDFDDSGFGFRAYDLATAEVQGLEDPMNPIASSAIFDGYTLARDPNAPPLGSVPFFVAMRAFASAGWIISRAGPDDPRQRFYAERALRAARTLVP